MKLRVADSITVLSDLEQGEVYRIMYGDVVAFTLCVGERGRMPVAEMKPGICNREGPWGIYTPVQFLGWTTRAQVSGFRKISSARTRVFSWLCWLPISGTVERCPAATLILAP